MRKPQQTRKPAQLVRVTVMGTFGAINLGGTCGKVLREKRTATVFRIPQPYEKLLGDAGISNDKSTVVVYGDAKGITDATVGFWVLEYLGQKDVRSLTEALRLGRLKEKTGYRRD